MGRKDSERHKMNQGQSHDNGAGMPTPLHANGQVVPLLSKIVPLISLSFALALGAHLFLQMLVETVITITISHHNKFFTITKGRAQET